MNANAIKIMSVISRAGHQVFLVGGSVRDQVMGETPHDFDITTSANPETVMRLFPKVIPSGIAFGTVTVMMDGEGFEVTTMRGDGRYTDGRRPDSVNFVTDIKEDLSRRDFTMNAMAMRANGEVVDPFNGQADIAARVIRCVGNPDQRFQEDGLRIMRAVRFAARFGFEIEANTRAAIRTNAALLDRVSRERVRDELVKMLTAPHPEIGLRLMAETGLLAHVIPDAVPMVGCGQNHFHDFDVWEHTVRCVSNVPQDKVLRLAALFHDIGKPKVKAFDAKRGEHGFYDHNKVSAELCRAIMHDLKFSNEEIEAVSVLVDRHMVALDGGVKDSTIRRFLREIDTQLDQFLALRRADIVATRADPNAVTADLVATDTLEFRCRTLVASTPKPGAKLPVSGADVMERLNLRPGPEVGKVLRRLMDHVLEHPEDNNRDTLMSLI
jgi:tRNA nucleotidyltransferase (CCA-adding enzyme)